ncbi:Line-1 retrotransposable element orf2 protein, partial [Thalictrum thalictroides]
MSITELNTPTNMPTTDLKQIADLIQVFYASLYQGVDIEWEVQANFLRSIQREDQLHPDDQLLLTLPVTTQEVHKVLTNYPCCKCPGPDGVPFELYATHSRLLAYPLSQLFNQCLMGGLQLPGGELSYLCLLFKKGDRADLKNWRPLAMSNTDFKLLTKVLTNRLAKAAPKVISPHQLGFIPGQSIWDNIHKVHNVLLANNSSTNGVLQFLDMEKAYDRVNWPFLFQALEWAGIPSIFVGWVRTLYTGLQTQVICGAGLTQPISIEQGLRQGDPMSPLLFNFVADTLLRALEHNLQGITVCSSQFRTVAFADDTVVGIGSGQDMCLFWAVMRDYCQASNAKLNVSKTVTVRVGKKRTVHNPLTPSIPPQETFRHLGVLFNSHGVAIRENQEKIIDAMLAWVQSWGQRNISLVGHGKAATIFLLSKIWYVAHIIPFQESFFKDTRRLLQRWMWAPAKHPPACLEVLNGKVQLGGMGLLDIKLQSWAILTKFLTPILGCSNFAGALPEWARIARTLCTKALGIASTSHTALPAHFTTIKPKLPKSKFPIWREYIKALKASPLSFVESKEPQVGRGCAARRIDLLAFGVPHSYSKKPINPTPPEALAPILERASLEGFIGPTWQPNNLWDTAGLRVAPARWRSTTWR